jgi:YggT family protein
MLASLVDLILFVFWLVELLVIGAVIAGWLNADPTNFLVRILRETTEPLFRLVRPLARKIPGPLDWAPMIVLLGIEVIKRVLVHLVR